MRSAINQIRLGSLIILLLSIAACGRYGPPRPPEDFTPRAVTNIGIEAKDTGLLLTWKGPNVDVRGRDLKSLDGYRIFRKFEAKDEKLDIDSFEEIAFVNDTNLKERDEARKVARSEMKISRRISVPEEKKIFTYEDSGLENGKVYLYQIIPVNQGDESGAVHEYIRVEFTGLESKGELYTMAEGGIPVPRSVFEEEERPIFSFGG